MLSHANLHFSGAAAQAASHVPGVNRTLLTLPLSHSYGLLVTITGMHSPELGVAVLLRWFDPARFLELIAEHRLEGHKGCGFGQAIALANRDRGDTPDEFLGQLPGQWRATGEVAKRRQVMLLQRLPEQDLEHRWNDCALLGQSGRDRSVCRYPARM